MAGEPDLQPYTSDEWVLYLQQLLQNAGYSCPQDSAFDDSTLTALHAFQADYGLAQNDNVGAATWEALTSSSSSADTSSSTESSTVTDSGGGGEGGAGAGGEGGAPVSDDWDSGTGGEEGSGPGTDPENPVPLELYAIDAASLWPDCETVKIWFKAFIPGDCEGTLDGVGDSAGVRLIRGIPVVGDCFYTDNRGFSADITASARMHSEVVIDVRSGQVVNELHFCGQTVEADCEDGSHGDCTDQATLTGSFANLSYGADNTISVSFHGAASDPCLYGLAPDVDYVGTFTIDVENHTVSFDGTVDGFPAFESYATVNHGAGTEVFTYGPRGGAFDLMGGASDAVSGTAQL